MLISDISNQIFLNMGQPNYTSIPAISFFIRSKVGSLNTLLYEDFYVKTTPTYNTDGSIAQNPDYEIYNNHGKISSDAVAILQQLYKIYDLEAQIRSLTNAMAPASLVLVEDNGSKVKYTDRNEIAKMLLTWKKQEMEYFDKLVTAYRCSAGKPSQIAGDDTIRGYAHPFYYTDMDHFAG